MKIRKRAAVFMLELPHKSYAYAPIQLAVIGCARNDELINELMHKGTSLLINWQAFSTLLLGHNNYYRLLFSAKASVSKILAFMWRAIPSIYSTLLCCVSVLILHSSKPFM